MERQKFEDSWKEAFDQAEVSPSENIWTNIELDIEKAKGSRLKKRLVVFQLLAAASVVFSVGAGIGIYWMAGKTGPATTLAVDHRTENESVRSGNSDAETSIEKLSSGIAATDEREVGRAASERNAESMRDAIESSPDPRSVSGKPMIAAADQHAVANENDNDRDQYFLRKNATVNGVAEGSLETSTKGGNDTPATAGTMILTTASADQNTDNVLLSENTIAMPSLVRTWQPRLHLPQPAEKADPVALMLARLEEREREVQEAKEPADKKETPSEKLWTSLGFAAGSFNSTNAGVSGNNNNATLAMNRSIANEEVKAPGTTYSVGVNVGTRLSQRWVFQGGVNYQTQSSDYTANTAVRTPGPDNDHASFRPQSINELEKLETAETSLSTADSKMLVTTAPYNVNNNIRYLSIPMQAGYLIVNRTVGLQLNAGISTDLFLQNTVTADGQNLDNTSQRRGEDSPYRSVNFSGLMGTEVSYRFGTRYRLSLNPGIRYPFNSIYKSNLDIKAMPLTFDIGLRFRYIFH